MIWAKRILAAVALSFLSEGAIAQTSVLPRTIDGRPDLQGVWESRWFTPLERPPGPPVLSMNAAQAKGFQAAGLAARDHRPGNANPDSDLDTLNAVLEINGEFRTSQIINPPDGRIPLTEAGRRQTAYLLGPADGPEARGGIERCIAGPGRAPMISPPSNAYIQIVQPQGRVMIMAETLNDVRELAPGAPGRSRGFASISGDATSSWEGDTLVVETRNLRDEVRYAPPMSYIPLSPASVIRERFEPLSADRIKYSFTVTDPVLYSRPWSAETIYARTTSHAYEYACHEANYAMVNILKGQRVVEARAAKPR